MSSKTPPLSPAAVLDLSQERGVLLDADQAARLTEYLELLERWNRSMNLVGKKHWPEILCDLLLDSWRLAGFLEQLELPDGCLSYDLGAGAGLPGIPLRLFWGRGRYLLVELRAKRAMFLRYALAALAQGLKGPTEVFEGRAETVLARDPGPNLVLSRAFLPWEQVLALVRDALAPGACVVFMASDPAPAAPEGWSVRAASEYPAPGAKSGRRYFWGFSPVNDSRSESLKINLVATASAASPSSISRSKKSKSS